MRFAIAGASGIRRSADYSKLKGRGFDGSGRVVNSERGHEADYRAGRLSSSGAAILLEIELALLDALSEL